MVVNRDNDIFLKFSFYVYEDEDSLLICDY